MCAHCVLCAAPWIVLRANVLGCVTDVVDAGSLVDVCARRQRHRTAGWPRARPACSLQASYQRDGERTLTQEAVAATAARCVCLPGVHAMLCHRAGRCGWRSNAAVGSCSVAMKPPRKAQALQLGHALACPPCDRFATLAHCTMAASIQRPAAAQRRLPPNART